MRALVYPHRLSLTDADEAHSAKRERERLLGRLHRLSLSRASWYTYGL